MTAKNRSWSQTLTTPVSYSGSYLSFGSTTIPISSTFTPTGQYSFQYYEKSRAWYTTTNWKATKQANGFVPSLPMGENLSYSVQSYQLGVFKVNFPGYQVGSYSGPVIVKVPNGMSAVIGSLYDTQVSALEADVKSKALAKARDMKTNVAVFFGEGRQTVRMIRGTAERLGRAYRHFRKGRFGNAAKELGINKPTGSAANHWLEYTYGWSPLLSDAKGLAELAAQQVGVGGRQRRFSVHAKSEFNALDRTNSNPTAPCNYPYGELVGYWWDYDFTATAHAGLLLEVDCTSSQLAAQTGFGLTDPLLFGWELTPFSFVFDWFIDVGTYLENLSSLQGLVVKDGFWSLTQSSKGTARGSAKDNSGWILQMPSPKLPFHHRSYSRQAWNGSVPTIRYPLFDGLSARRLVSAASLWRQRLRGDRVPGGYHP